MTSLFFSKIKCVKIISYIIQDNLNLMKNTIHLDTIEQLESLIKDCVMFGSVNILKYLLSILKTKQNNNSVLYSTCCYLFFDKHYEYFTHLPNGIHIQDQRDTNKKEILEILIKESDFTISYLDCLKQNWTDLLSYFIYYNEDDLVKYVLNTNKISLTNDHLKRYITHDSTKDSHAHYKTISIVVSYVPDEIWNNWIVDFLTLDIKLSTEVLKRLEQSKKRKRTNLISDVCSQAIDKLCDRLITYHKEYQKYPCLPDSYEIQSITQLIYLFINKGGQSNSTLLSKLKTAPYKKYKCEVSKFSLVYRSISSLETLETHLNN